MLKSILPASSYTIAGPVGTLFAGIFMEVYGRRWNNITANAAMLAGWLLIAAAQDKFMILFGRIAEGFSRCMLHTGVAVRLQKNQFLVI
jgi:MFS family permease